MLWSMLNWPLVSKLLKIVQEIINNNNKFIFAALNNSAVWADGLIVFYEIFKFLEENVPEIILPRDYYRTECFEQDLQFYLGEDWKRSYQIRESVANYLKHLYDIKDKNPLLLIAYVYHLYMGLLSGGQILAKKRQLTKKFSRNSEQRDDPSDDIEPGTALTSYPNKSITEMKNNLKKIIDEYAKDFDEKTRRELIVESRKVFEFNNTIIQSVEGVTKQNLKLLGYILLALFSVYVFIKMWAV
jgi:heme oxygenase